VKNPPPTLVRRVVVAPLVVLVCLVFVLLAPLWLLAGLVVGGRGGLRLTAFAVVFAACEAAMILELFVLWIGSGFGLWLRRPWMQSAHYAAMRGWLHWLSGAAISLLGLRIEVVDAPPRAEPGPILVFGRHGGAGNSLMMIRTLMLRYGRRPRIVMLAFLQWDPVTDVICHRLPSLFITHEPESSDEFVRRIGTLASDMGAQDALVLYPEGHDFTERLRLRAIAHLRREGHAEAAERAEEMDRVLPPRHRGPLAAILAAPDADVVLVAHTTLEEVGTFRELYRRLPLDRPVKARYWRVPAAEVPREKDALIPWLFDWWKTIDDWIEVHSP
jgi:hypothetical protein